MLDQLITVGKRKVALPAKSNPCKPPINFADHLTSSPHLVVQRSFSSFHLDHAPTSPSLRHDRLTLDLNIEPLVGQRSNLNASPSWCFGAVWPNFVPLGVHGGVIASNIRQEDSRVHNTFKTTFPVRGPANDGFDVPQNSCCLCPAVQNVCSVGLSFATFVGAVPASTRGTRYEYCSRRAWDGAGMRIVGQPLGSSRWQQIACSVW